LPEIEEFLESPEEKRLRRIRAGVVMGSIGLGASLLLFLLSLPQHDFIPFIGLGVVLFLIGLGMVINGLAFTVPRKKLVDRSEEASPKRSSSRERPTC
jgi:O-antigen/teichoic acid export membrane protein